MPATAPFAETESWEFREAVIVASMDGRHRCCPIPTASTIVNVHLSGIGFARDLRTVGSPRVLPSDVEVLEKAVGRSGQGFQLVFQEISSACPLTR